MESVTPLVFWKRELLTDSGGAGRARGGLGQHIELVSASDAPLDVMTQFDRVEHPAAGLFGGLPGGRSRLVLNGSRTVPGKGRFTMQKGDRLAIDYAGGGGYGPPRERKRESVIADLREGLISAAAARDLYGIDVEEAR
jgi:N-methylhydantoinase B